MTVNRREGQGATPKKTAVGPPPRVRLWLVRHAPAEDARAFSGPDLARPLTRKGRASARQAFRGLARLAEAPTRIVTSSALRAVQTAELLAKVWAARAAPVEDARLAPGASPARIRAVIRDYAEPGTTLALVGHEPDLGNLVSRLTGLWEADFKKAGVAELDLAPDGKQAALRAWLPPRVLRNAG